MDPNALLQRLESLLDGIDPEVPLGAECFDELWTMAADLKRWRNQGGFAPDWLKCPKATAFYRTLYGRNAR